MRACVRVCSREGNRLWLWGGGNMCRRFDLWGSEHDNYYLPSKKLTTALRASKLSFPFYYIIRPMTLDSYALTSAHAARSYSEPGQSAARSMFATLWGKKKVASSFLVSDIKMTQKQKKMQSIQRCNNTVCALICPWLSLWNLPLRNNGRPFNGIRVHADVYTAQLGSAQITACAIS